MLTGCTSLSGSVQSGVSLSQFENLSKSKGNYYGSGRILFKHPEGKHSGEMEIHISADSELRLSIFTPLVGSIMYELRVGPEKFLLLNFQEKTYVLDENNRYVRLKWLGMDLSMTELKWLILGQLPEKNPAWQQTKLSTGDLQLVQGTSVIHLRLNSAGRIQSMNKLVKGILEYKARISHYQKHLEILFPRTIQIEDFTGNNSWLMIISEIQAPTKVKSLDFTPDENMNLLISKQ